MEKVLISDEDLAAKMGRNLSDNLYYEDRFSIPAFVRFCKNLPSMIRVQFYTDDFPDRDNFGDASKRVVKSVHIHFLERGPITIDLCSDWFLSVFLKDRGFVCEFTSCYKLYKIIKNET